MTDREAMRLALKALESGLAFSTHSPVLQALRAQLEQPEQEPVAWMVKLGDVTCFQHHADSKYESVPLYTSPPQQQAEPPTCAWSFEDDDTGTYSSACGELWSFIDGGWKDNRVNFCHGCGGKVVEAKLNETP